LECRPSLSGLARWPGSELGYLFLPLVLRVVFLDDLRAGTFAPFSRASLKPIAIACLRLVTLRPDPLLSVPFFLRRTADATRFDADFPYFAMLPPPSIDLAIHVLEPKAE
jgi:hypothetical protein